MSKFEFGQKVYWREHPYEHFIISRIGDTDNYLIKLCGTVESEPFIANAIDFRPILDSATDLQSLVRAAEWMKDHVHPFQVVNDNVIREYHHHKSVIVEFAERMPK